MSIPKPDDSDYEDEPTTARMDLLSAYTMHGRLERDGLVRLEPNRGAFVAEFTDRDLFEIYELRELLEPHAAAIACAVATRADVAELRDLRDRIAAVWAEEPMEAFELNREFHHRLCAPC